MAIIDLTGVPQVDLAVARRLLETFRAARLLGAKLGPVHAQTMIRLGVDLQQHVRTEGTLAAGLRYAMRIAR